MEFCIISCWKCNFSIGIVESIFPYSKAYSSFYAPSLFAIICRGVIMNNRESEDFSKIVKEFLGNPDEVDLDEETVSQMTDHELLSCKFAEWDPYEEEIIIAEMNKRGFGSKD